MLRLTLKKATLALALLLWMAPTLAPAQDAESTEPWSVRMAETVMEQKPDFTPEWEYEMGVMLKGFHELYERTGDEKYWDYLKRNVDRFVQPDGDIRTYTIQEYNIDNIAPGKLLFSLYEETGDERYLNAADTLREQLHGHPRTSEGGFWHKEIYPHQIWLDGVYMMGPFLTRYGRHFDEPEAFDEVTKEILLVSRYMRDAETGLYYHGWDESRQQRWADNKTGLSKNFWGRGMGWYGMALVDVLDYLPEDHPDRGEIIRVLQNYAEAVSDVQDPVTGVWYQILDKPSRPKNYLEASASSMFTYTLAKGVRKGYLDDKYLDVAQRAHAGIVEEFVEVTDEGLVNLCCGVSVGGLGGDDPYRDGTFKYYMSEPLRMNDNKAVGPFIMASLQLEAVSE